ncbi:hypothetical protein [Methyloglobulus sp.]|uniref:hypothetical protein n=1 Tax=Methyloglobulus sp. TaxID=2518622 RepID=UPI0032B82E82
MACEELKSQLDSLVAERNDLREELRTTDFPQQKSYLAAQIKALNKQITLISQELDLCMMQNPTETGPTAINSTLMGSFTLIILHPSIPDPITGPFDANVNFNATRTSLTIIQLAPLTGTFDTPIGPNTTIVTLNNPNARGVIDKPSGTINILISLFFNQTIELPIPFYEEGSTIDFPMGTAAGSPLDNAGNFTIFGASVFSGGILGGYSATLSITGQFQPVP